MYVMCVCMYVGVFIYVFGHVFCIYYYSSTIIAPAQDCLLRSTPIPGYNRTVLRVVKNRLVCMNVVI